MRDGRSSGTILGADQVIIMRGEEGKKRILEAPLLETFTVYLAKP